MSYVFVVMTCVIMTQLTHQSINSTVILIAVLFITILSSIKSNKINGHANYYFIVKETHVGCLVVTVIIAMSN